MAKKIHVFPESCCGCDGVYTHMDFMKLYSGGCMKSLGNSYCTKGKRHFKLLKRDIYQKRPSKCPIIKKHPIVVTDEDEGGLS